MNSKLFIADKFKVGFNLRDDTYTGKLGYVIGYDGKKWRKEPSWESWRLKFIEADEIEVKKLASYNYDISRQTTHYNSMVESLSSTPEKYSKTHYYREETKLSLGKHLDNRVGKYENYKTNLGLISCDKGIIPQEYDNVPTEGFVLNKKAGGGSSGWNHRSTYCRVYDPRGFEFEISIPNLLYILQECTSTKGKGLDGEFVYAWDGKDLVLLPTVSEDYRSSTKFTNLQSGKVGTKDLIEGCVYKDKNMFDYVYLGKFTWVSDYNYTGISCFEKRYIFYDVSGNRYDNFHSFKNTSNFVQIVSNIAVSNYGELLDKYNKSKYSGVINNPILNDAVISKLNVPYTSRNSLNRVCDVLLPLGGDKFEVYSVDGEIDYIITKDYKYSYKHYNLVCRRTLQLKDGGDFEIKAIKIKKLDALKYSEITNMGLKNLSIKNNDKIKILKF